MARAAHERWHIIPDGISEHIGSYMGLYVDHMKIKGYSPGTIKMYSTYLGFFQGWCDERGVLKPVEVTRLLIESYLSFIYHYKGRRGKNLTRAGQIAHINPVKLFFKWMSRNHHILYNPAGEIELPKLEKRIPKHVLSISEAEKVLDIPDLSKPIGIRDRSILETFYSTGMRRAELANLKIDDLDIERGTVLIQQGKGSKDRMIPIGDRAITWIRKYIDVFRDNVAPDLSSGLLYLTTSGSPVLENRLTQMVRNYVNRAEIPKKGSCHMFRHTMATLMLEEGADIRFIQAMLGHSRFIKTSKRRKFIREFQFVNLKKFTVRLTLRRSIFRI